MKQHKLTTNDNPFDPFEDFDNWFLYDIEKGYNSCSMLDRIVVIQDNYSEVDISNAIETAINNIIKYDFTDSYKKVTKEFPDLDEEQSDSV